MIRKMRVPIALIAILTMAALAACGGGDESRVTSDGAFAAAVVEKEVVREVIKEEPVERVMVEVAREVEARPPAFAAPSVVDEARAQAGSTAAPDTVLVSQQRIIVRTLDMGLMVSDVSATMDKVADLAKELDGWVVSSDRSQKHRGSISVRVPAESLDDSIARLRAMADEVESEVSTSRDVTDEYVDLTARLGNLEATEAALVKLLDKATKVEDALEVQRELSKVQGDVESLQGRIKFLEQTSAFSLVNVRLKLTPQEMSVDSGVDQTASVGQITRFRASFKPPEDIERFEYTWDFGDGSGVVSGNRTAPTLDEDTRVTATVTHVYRDDRDSPYIAEIEIQGFGDAGVVEGEDILIVSVTELPTIEVFAGEGKVVEDGEEAEFIGTFTRPEGLTEVTFEWDFGDGSPPVTVSVGEGETRAVAKHAYRDHRPAPYKASLTITAKAEGGEVESTGSLSVFVTESAGWTISGWSAGDTGKTAVRALSAVGQALGTAGIWLAIFSPAWLALLIVVFALRRRRGRRSTAEG